MSAVQSTEYRVVRSGHRTFRFAIDRLYRNAAGIGGERVDLFRSQCAAEYAARLLNEGLATVNHHAVVGCRVEVR